MVTLFWTAVIAAAVLTIYEVAKEALVPNISIWESHTLTIIFGTIMATGLAFLALWYRERLEEGYAKEQRKWDAAEIEAAAHGEVARAVIDNAAAVVVILSPDRRIVEFNPKAESVYGRSRSQVIGQDYIDLFVPEPARAAVLADIQKVMDEQPTRGFENEIVTLSGETHIFSWSVNRYLDYRGEPAGAVVIGFDVTERKQAEIELDLSYRTQRTLNSLLKLSLAEMELDEQLEQALDIILAAPFIQLKPKGGIFLAATEGSELELRVMRNLPEPLKAMCGKVPFGECLCGRAAAEGRMLFSGRDDERHDHHYEGMVPHGHYVIPIKSATGKERVLGVIVLYIRPDHSQKEYEERFLQAAADILAGLIEKNEARQRLAASERQYRTLAEAAPDIIAIIDRGHRLEYINSIGAERLGRTPVEMVGRPLHTLPDSQLARPLFDQVDRVLDGGGPASFEQAVETPDASIWLDIRLVPLATNGEIFSVMAIGRDITERKELELFGRSLNHINLTINSTLDIDRIMAVVAEEAAKTIGAESGVVAIRSGDFWEIKYVAGLLPKKWTGRRVPLAEAAEFSLVSAARKPTILEKTEAEATTGAPGWITPLAVRAFLGTPLVVKDRQVGILAFLNHESRRTFTPHSADFVAKLAVSVSLALENARLFAQEHGIAETLQRALLTVPDELEGVKVGHLYRSATREAALVGGDFYDLFDLGPERVGLIIGDVSGKGLEAATVTSLVKNTIKAFAHYYQSPAVVMERANSIVAKSVPRDAFVTVFLAVLETGSGHLAYTGAGHPPPLVKRETGQVDALDPSGPVLGTFDRAVYSTSFTRLEPGDTLFCYTDGLTEARSGADFFGEDRVMKIMTQAAPREPDLCVADVFEVVMEFTGGNLSDDLALLAVSLDTPEHGAGSQVA